MYLRISDGNARKIVAALGCVYFPEKTLTRGKVYTPVVIQDTYLRDT